MGLGASASRLLAWGLGGDGVTTATPVEVIQGQPYYKLHGWNRHRLFKYGGRFPGRK